MVGNRIKITAGDVVMSAELGGSETAQLLWDALPIQASANIWGDEIYFGVGINGELDDDAEETVELGTVGYWPPGDALCLFFGPTPASRGDEIRPASPVNIVGKIVGDPTVLRDVRSGQRVLVEKA